MIKRQLVLENGSVFEGTGFGSDDSISGELVFNTAMTGYQEAISDPAYYGQIVMMTYPLIGNYGINRDDFETVAPFVNGIVVKELCDHPSNFRSDESMSSFLKAHNIPGIQGIDTRKLMRVIREYGTLKARITDIHQAREQVIEELKTYEGANDQVKQTSTLRPYVVPGRGVRIVLVDFGMKHGVLRELTKRNCHITVVPYNYSAEQISRLKPDGILLTSGPGNPEDVASSIEMVQELKHKFPFFGIGLGHQIFALACGAKVEKMKFGHRGANYPVKDIEKDKTLITSQNHGYTINEASLADTSLCITQIVLNDQTIAGIKHTEKPAFSVQYYPESSPGPEDTNYLFDEFIDVVKSEIIKKEQTDD